MSAASIIQELQKIAKIEPLDEAKMVKVPLTLNSSIKGLLNEVYRLILQGVEAKLKDTFKSKESRFVGSDGELAYGYEGLDLKGKQCKGWVTLNLDKTGKLNAVIEKEEPEDDEIKVKGTASQKMTAMVTKIVSAIEYG